MIASTLLLVAILLILCAAGFDLAFRAVPNWLPAVLALDGVALRTVSGTLPTGLAAAAAVFAGCALLWRFGLVGGGDVKLLGAAALAVPDTGALLVCTALAGGVLAGCYLALRTVVAPAAPAAGPARRRPLFARLARVERRRIRAGSLPYCLAVAAGVLATLAGA